MGARLSPVMRRLGGRHKRNSGGGRASQNRGNTVESRKVEWDMGSRPTETMAVYRNNAMTGIDWVVTAIWLFVIALIATEIWAIASGNTDKLVAVWCAMACIYCWVDMHQRRPWGALAEFVVGFCAMVAGAALWGGVA